MKDLQIGGGRAFDDGSAGARGFQVGEDAQRIALAEVGVWDDLVHWAEANLFLFARRVEG